LNDCALSCIAGLDPGETPLPLQCLQLTRLQLCTGEYTIGDVLAMASELPQLEILEVLQIEHFDISDDDAMALSRLPKLQTVNISDAVLCESSHAMDPAGTPRWVPICECMEAEVVEDLLRLRQAAPRINWVMEGMHCCDKRAPLQGNPIWDWYSAGTLYS
jgi:hypothetical protein